MDLYYRYEPNFLRGYGPPTAKEAAGTLSAFAARLAYSMVWAIPNLPAASRDEFVKLLSVGSLWTLSIVFAGWLLATVIGGMIGVAVNVLLILYGVSGLWDEINRIAEHVKEWLRAAYDANTAEALEKAGEPFARALTAGLLTAIQLLVTHRAFKSIERVVKKRYPPPKDLQAEWDKALKRVGEKSRAAEKVLRTSEIVVTGARGKGMQETANVLPSEFPTAAVVVAAGVAVVGAAVALSLSAGNKK